jgi:hypothetical protein
LNLANVNIVINGKSMIVVYKDAVLYQGGTKEAPSRSGISGFELHLPFLAGAPQCLEM